MTEKYELFRNSYNLCHYTVSNRIKQAACIVTPVPQLQVSTTYVQWFSIFSHGPSRTSSDAELTQSMHWRWRNQVTAVWPSAHCLLALLTKHYWPDAALHISLPRDHSIASLQRATTLCTSLHTFIVHLYCEHVTGLLYQVWNAYQTPSHADGDDRLMSRAMHNSIHTLNELLEQQGVCSRSTRISEAYQYWGVQAPSWGLEASDHEEHQVLHTAHDRP